MASLQLQGPPEARQWIAKTGILSTSRLLCESQGRDAEKSLMDALFDGKESEASSTHTLSSLSPPGLSLPGQPSVVFMGRTQNDSATFKATGSSCLDFFFHVHQLTPVEDVWRRLALAWAEDPLMALKLVMQLRGVRGTGKSHKQGFLAAAMWIHQHHPKTLLANLALIPSFGCFKDLLVLVRRVLDEDPQGQSDLFPKLRSRWGPKQLRNKERRRRKLEAPRAERLRRTEQEMAQRKETAAEERRKKRVRLAVKVLVKYERDERFRDLHDAVGKVFAEALQRDMRALQRFQSKDGAGEEQVLESDMAMKKGDAEGREDGAGSKWKGSKGPHISLAAKWAPSLDSSFDRRTLLVESIARQFFREQEGEAAAMEMQVDGESGRGETTPASALEVRDRLRKEVLVPLRKALEVPEVYMSAGRWGALPYGRVPSVCMKNNSKHFQAHDGARFQQFLEDVREGKAKIAAGAVLPHEVLLEALKEGSKGGVAQLQWARIVEDVKATGTMGNCIAVCDVSGSMSGLPMEVAVALSLLISEISCPPWKGHIITFSAQPQIHRVQGDTVAERASFTMEMDWGMNTDLQKVFASLLDRARAHKVQPEGMVKRIYIFSDMEFDVACPSDNWATDHEEIVRKYSEAGYPVPEIVYWNLRHSTQSTPVCMSQPGTALISGFSKNILGALLEGRVMTPLLVMQCATEGKLFEQLRIVD